MLTAYMVITLVLCFLPRLALHGYYVIRFRGSKERERWAQKMRKLRAKKRAREEAEAEASCEADAERGQPQLITKIIEARNNREQGEGDERDEENDHDFDLEGDKNF